MAMHAIATANRTGSRLFVTDGSTIAKARWTGGSSGMWAYDTPGAVEQLDFEPTHWCDDPTDIIKSGAAQ